MSFKQCEIRTGRQKSIEINARASRLPKCGASHAAVGAVERLAGNLPSGINLSRNAAREARDGSEVFDLAAAPTNCMKCIVVGGRVPHDQQPRVRFGVFEADLATRELYKRGTPIRVQEKPFQILSLLLEHPGEIITREELKRKLWSDGTFVEFEKGLNTAVKKLRLALGDSTESPIFVETIPRRGYRFIAPIVHIQPAGLFDQVLDLMGRFVPPDGMNIVRKVLADVVTPNRGAFLSLGFLATLWTASGGFAAAIEALNIAYDAEETRPFWKTRPLAMILTLLIGLLLLVALAVMILGPHFGEWLANRMHLSRVWLWAWPYIHWMIAVGFAVLAVEALYFLAPNVKQRFRATLPGAVLSVLFWIGLSYLLGIYFRTFANFNKTYGTLGAGIALMVWLYWTGFAMLVGAELNAELAKRTKAGAVEQKEDPPAPLTLIA